MVEDEHYQATRTVPEESIVETNTNLLTVDIGSIDLNVFALCKANTRKRTFVQLAKRFVVEDLPQVPAINQGKYSTFLDTLFDSYRSYNVTYHNDMHGLDVAQMTYILLKTGPDSLYT
jgi:calcium/calmodulin-dependent 3',5'-cyclic nucleotide phosphodiesterase